MSILSLKNVTKTYFPAGETFYALKGVCIDIREGEFVSITGPSGSGKSTLMHIIGLLDQPTEGQVLFNDQDVSRLNETKLATIRNQGLGFVFQQFNLLAKTPAWENVGLPLLYAGIPHEKRYALAIDMLNKVGLGDKIINKPSQLSGGQQQRVAIARALINDPKIILADEPTGNLDSKSGKEIIALFHQLNSKEKRTIILVTHDPDVAKQAKRIIRIVDGKIVGNSKPC